ncbi:MAG: transcription antitermination factor NusB [Oscillospiraceae bacterium]
MKRREAREAAFLLIFEKSFRREEMSELIDIAIEGRSLELDDYARHLVDRTEERLEEIDDAISEHLSRWKLERLPRVTLAVLRMAICELDDFPDIPLRVTINEALELAKRYGTEEDASYINGVLGSYVKAKPPVKNPEAEIEAPMS